MSSTGSDQIIKQDDAAPPTPLNQTELAAVGPNGSSITITGWQPVAGHRVDLAISIQARNGMVLTGTVPTLHMILAPRSQSALASGGQTVELDIADVRGKVARAWADELAAESEGLTEDLGLGPGFVKGPSALIDQGRRLITLVYNDGGSAQGLSNVQARDRLLGFEDRVRGLARSAR